MKSQLGDVPGVSVTRPQEVSVFLLVIWIFALKKELSNHLKQRIRIMYGNSSSAIDSITPTIEAFSKAMTAIKKRNKKCVVKVLVDEHLSKDVLEIASKEPQIIQVYLFSPKGDIHSHFRKEMRTNSAINKPQHSYLQIEQKQQEEEQGLLQVRSEMLPRGSKVVKVVLKLEDAVTRAENEVQAFTKSFRTFQNSHCLIGDFDRINRYRFRLIAFLNIKISDYSQSLNDFRKFVYKVLPWLNRHLKGMGRRDISSNNLITSLNKYYTAVAEWMELEAEGKDNDQEVVPSREKKDTISSDREDSYANKREASYIDKKKTQTESRESFYHQVLSIYQEEGFFYHLINSHLKMVGELNSDWRQLSLPFSHLHRAIKYLYKQGLSLDPQFYCNPFTVFRSGRCRKSELNRYEALVQTGGAFLQFFGFLSTSLKAKMVSDYLLSLRNSRDSGWEEEQGDEQIIFRIAVDPSALKQAAKFDFIINGFFKMSNKQRKGDRENEVLFNALNIFRLLDVKKMKVSELFNQDEKRQVEDQRQKNRAFAFLHSSQEAIKLRFYDSEITVVDLQFGSFYRVVVTSNPFDLTQNERAAKENIAYFMNQVNRYHSFDFGDACELSNDYQGAYEYWKSKVGEGEDQFKCSRTDSKNYFEKLSAICSKLGKVKEALSYSRVAVECCRQLESIHLNQAYNIHYERLYEMQMRSVEIYRETSNFAAAQKQLKSQLQQIRSRNFEEPKAKMRESEVYINQAINFYSMGKLEECINRLAKCEHKLKKTISDFSFQLPRSCCVPAFLKQLICPHPGLLSRRLNYCRFAQDLHELHRREHEEELVRKHGQKEKLQQTSQLATELLGVAQKAIANRSSLFQSRRKYMEFVSRFSQQFALSLQSQHEQDGERARVEQKIRKSIMEVSSIDQEDPKYGEALTRLNELIRQFNQLDHSNLSSSSDSSTWEFIKKFKQGERERKIRRLEAMKETILSENRQQLVEKYLRCAAEIECAITELKKEGYADISISILKLRQQKSRMLQLCDERAAAMHEIDEIIRGGVVQGEVRFTELAHAYSVKGSIHLQMGEVLLAVQSYNQALRCFPKNVADDLLDERLDVSEVTENSKDLHPIGTQNKVEQLQYNNEYMQTRILRVKALLMWVEIKRKRQYSIPILIFDPQSELPWQMRHSDQHMLQIQTQISKIRAVLTSRSTLQDMSDLQSELLQAEAYYHFNMPHSQQNLAYGFQCLRECMTLRNRQMGNNNMKNALMCCDLVSRNSSKRDFFSLFQQFKLTECLRAAQADIHNCTFAWKIQYSFYLLESSEGDGQSPNAIKHLQRAIQCLQDQLSKKHEDILEKELCRLKQRLAEYTTDHQQHYQESKVQMLESELQELEYGIPMYSKMKKRISGNTQSIITKRNFTSSTKNSMISGGHSVRVGKLLKPLQNPEIDSSQQATSIPLQRYWKNDRRKKGNCLMDQ